MMPIRDKTLYPKCWKQISHFVRFFRAGNRCEWCGVENHKPHPHTGSGVVLTVAHLDHNPKNNRLGNLAALCQRCHNRYDQKKRVENARITRYENKHRGQGRLWENERS